MYCVYEVNIKLSK